MIADLFDVIMSFLLKILSTIGTFLADTFSGLFGLLWRIAKYLLKGLWKIASWIGDVLKSVIEWLAKVIAKLFDMLFTILRSFFEVIYDVIKAIMYFFYMVAMLAVELFMVILTAAKLLISLILGFFRTLASLTFKTQKSSGNGYSETIGKIMTVANDNLQLNVVAVVLAFLIWIFTAVIAMKLISSIRVGGD